MPDTRIIDFQPEHANAWKELNLAWIRQHWEPEASDYKALDYPVENVLEPGGCILLAERDGEIIGTCALLKMDDGGLELAKMSVAEHAQGQGLGVLLGEATIERARELGANRVYLETNSVLTPAISLYEKLGFKRLCLEDSPYSRCDVQMELVFGSE